MNEAHQAAERAAEVLREWNPLMHPNWTEDAIAAILAEYAPVIAERDRLKKQVEQLRGLVRELRGYVEDHGTPDNLKALDAALQEKPID